MKTIKIKLNRDCDGKTIIPFADLHLGDKNCNLSYVKSVIELYKNNDDVLFILNGDLMNNATRTSVSDIYSSTMSPMEQLDVLLKLFKPVKDKIIAIIGGNHERRTYKEDGIDISRIFARELGLEDRYAEDGALIFLRLGETNQKETKNSNKYRQVCYTIYATHGSGGGRSAGSKINALEQLSGIVDADVYIHSHTHLPAIFKQNYFRTDVRNSTVKEVEKLFINTGASLMYGGYAERAKYKPATQATPFICLNGCCKEITASI